ncbi:hypothetical protein [Propionivibrio dicarboxylicus]|uniref:Uncharacterized protein n=1 Tax=Propionivibrio dicarboxylicus TaxID=83767 RepID=A0A1G8ER94_9RHOO|nr:hypothetical protein [Propionivibrio dicarboxylicus]SDH72337.1 hypothetical protein SAMN05660652_02165 [Propionivibrio dicarboxylicus]
MNQEIASQSLQEDAAPPAATSATNTKRTKAAAVVKKGTPRRAASAKKPTTSQDAMTDSPPTLGAAKKSETKTTKNPSRERTVKAVASPKPPKAEKAKKPKLVRDSFTIPQDDYALFAALKQRALTLGIEIKKSELLRAGIVMLNTLDNGDFARAVAAIERIKTGRPKK